MRTLQEITKDPEINDIERQIIILQMRIEMEYGNKEENIELIRKSLMERKHLLDQMFERNEDYKELLWEFNDSLCAHLVQMREELIKGYEAIKPFNKDGEIEAIGKCFLVCSDPETEQTRMVFDALEHYNIHYESGVTGVLGWRYNPADQRESSENYLLYLSDDLDNWNDWFSNKEMTKDMNIIHAVHHLLDHTYFSIFDLLWIRDFVIDIKESSCYCSYSKDSGEPEDLDWATRDYLE